MSSKVRARLGARGHSQPGSHTPWGTRKGTLGGADHCDVLPHVGRAIGSRHLPAQGTPLVHLDAHSDLLAPPDLPAGADWAALCAEASISHWILPLVHRGYVGPVAWIRPAWALPELPEGRHAFALGADRASGRLRTSCAAAVYLEEHQWVPADALEAPIPATVAVATWPGAAPPPPLRALLGVAAAAGPAPWWLDVDLDTLATHNPFAVDFAEAFGAACWIAFTAPFRWLSARAQDATLPPATRQAAHAAGQAALEAAVAQLAKGDAPASEGGAPPPWGAAAHAELVAAMRTVRRRCAETPEMAAQWPPEWLCRAGLQWDQPHHASTDAEATALLDRLEQLLRRERDAADGLGLPTLVTVARSAADGYTPADRVDALLADLLARLRAVCGELDVHRHDQLGDGDAPG